jgi:hypothetical protein
MAREVETVVDLEQAELRFQELQTERRLGHLDQGAYRVEVAKLLFRDERGVFWMLDADDGTWFCNRGTGWEPGDPHAERPSKAYLLALERTRKRRRSWGVALGVAFVLLLVVLGAVVLWQWPFATPTTLQPTPTLSVSALVTIASPGSGSQVTLDQEVAVESTIDAPTGIELVDRVELRVDGQTVDTQSVGARIQPGQTSLPLSQPWLPSTAGEYEVVVVALSASGSPLGEAAITLSVVESSGVALPEPACVPDATFVADVTIPPGTAFPPGARMDKVWQVRNGGSCAWGVGYELVLLEGEGMGAPGAVPVPPTAAGEPADLAITLLAPEEVGVFTSIWQLQSPDGVVFGPTLALSIEVEALAEESLPPAAPADVKAEVSEDGEAVWLAWRDQSDNEDAFRVYRQDMEASIGLAPANAEVFVDEAVTCGNAYRYGVVAFNAAGASPIGGTVEVTLPPCAPTDELPTLLLSIVPTQVLATETFTVTFEVEDDLGVVQVSLWGEDTGNSVLDQGQVFTCTDVLCAGTWPVTVWLSETNSVDLGDQGGVLTEGLTLTLTFVGVALDTSGQESEQIQALIDLLPPE